MSMPSSRRWVWSRQRYPPQDLYEVPREQKEQQVSAPTPPKSMCSGGANMCTHELERHQCKKCSDPAHLTILRMIKASKATDKAKNRYDQTNFIDYCFVSNLIDDSEGKCCYCSQDIQFIHFQDNLATIERLDDSIGHIKGNCAIACRGCNVPHVKHPSRRRRLSASSPSFYITLLININEIQ